MIYRIPSYLFCGKSIQLEFEELTAAEQEAFEEAVRRFEGFARAD